MSKIHNNGYNPDILSCLANLSNDEVFTPPEIANQMLDLLPQQIWSNSSAKFLDPCCKSGVFLREIAKRLLKGLEKEIPDLQQRIDHIFHNQLYGISITELTSLLSRRSVYCSKYPNSKYSITKFADASGNIRYQRINHSWKNGKCEFCGAAASEYKRSKDLETHSYEWIHTLHPEGIFNMKFDVIIGNPPYQISDGGFGDSAKPIYNIFVEKSKLLSPNYIVMIIPARWYSGGKGLDAFRESMLMDKRIKILHDFPETSDCFPGLNIRGGICYFLWDKNYNGKCTVINNKANEAVSILKRDLLEKNSTTFIRYNKAINILHKVQARNEATMDSLVSSRKPFGISTNFNSYSKAPDSHNNILLFRNGGTGYINKNDIHKSLNLVNKIKLLVAKASPGSDEYPHLVFSEPIIALPNSACTETYLIVSTLKSVEEAKNLKKYMATKFFRFLVLLIKNTQDVPKRVYSFVPQQDLSIEWTDYKLFKKYNITEEEIAFINTLVKDVSWDGDNNGN